jgi:hypothetical protein
VLNEEQRDDNRVDGYERQCVYMVWWYMPVFPDRQEGEMEKETGKKLRPFLKNKLKQKETKV